LKRKEVARSCWQARLRFTDEGKLRGVRAVDGDDFLVSKQNFWKSRMPKRPLAHFHDYHVQKMDDLQINGAFLIDITPSHVQLGLPHCSVNAICDAPIFFNA
jgi:hypothetical protein